MALNIVFEGFVNEVKSFDWGTVAKVSHSQRAKKEDGSWETVGKDYLDVTLPAGVVVSENSLIKVEGTFKVSTFEKKDGTTGVALKVRAQSVEPVQRSYERGNVDNLTALGATPVDDGLPF